MFLLAASVKMIVVLICSLPSEMTNTLVTCCRDDAFDDLTVGLILSTEQIFIAVKNTFWILFKTISTTLSIYLVILSVSLNFKVWVYEAFLLQDKLLLVQIRGKIGVF